MSDFLKYTPPEIALSSTLANLPESRLVELVAKEKPVNVERLSLSDTILANMSEELSDEVFANLAAKGISA